ncbi:SdrD B-like domain protein [uncultured archaeon]|nr:SdrD B-like domain protein [uncultured archaeon]
MRKIVLLLLALSVVALVGVPGALAIPDYYGVLQSIYGGPTACQLDCHTSTDGPPPFTTYGTAFDAQSNHADVTGGGTKAALMAIGPPLATITVTPANVSLPVGGNQTFMASTLDSFGNQITANVTWTSSDTAVGTIGSTTGVFTAVGTGTTTITATGGGTGSGNVTGNATVNVTANVTAVPTFNISGFKINNATGSGIQGWNITLMNSTMQKSMMTDAGGSYNFMSLANGTYNVTEGMQAGWTNVSPMSQQVTIAGSDMMNVNFTNQPPSNVTPPNVTVPAFNISGFKINNATGSGVPGWNITLMNSTMQKSMLTGADGSYNFMSLANGTYNVTEEMKTGWMNVSPMSQQVTISGTDMMNVNFTNQPPSNVTPPNVTVPTFNISGFKINDTNGNGVWDSGEMGIENWNINLLNATTGTQMANTSTDAQGFYQFMNLTPGSYNVTEEIKPGFTPTNATSRMITVENMDAMNVNFTNQPVAPPTQGITSFVLTPELNTTLKGMPISITITALSGNVSQTLFNGMADINITANNVSAVSSPANVSFTNGNATIQVSSSVAQFVTVMATSATAANTSITGSTQVMFADKIFSLSKGWNLISIPNFAEPSSVSQLLKNVQNNGVVGFDSATGNFTTPTDLEPLFGYWINVTADNQSIGFIASTNIPSMPPTRKLSEGWNLIGVSASRSDPDTLSAGELFVDLKHGLDFTQWLYTRLVSFEQPAAPVTFVAGTDLSDATALKQGHGYWLFIKNIPDNGTNNVPWAGKQW